MALGALAGCEQDIRHQARVDPLEASEFFADGAASRPKVPGTIAQGRLKTDRHLHEGKVAGKPAETFPFGIAAADLRRGRERYTIFCAACHDGLGTGQGVIVGRGLRAPASFHTPRLRQAPPGYFFDVVTNGFGAMYPYADMIPARDRWRIVAYVRALQLSQDAPVEELEERDLDALRGVER